MISRFVGLENTSNRREDTSLSSIILIVVVNDQVVNTIGLFRSLTILGFFLEINIKISKT